MCFITIQLLMNQQSSLIRIYKQLSPLIVKAQVLKIDLEINSKRRKLLEAWHFIYNIENFLFHREIEELKKFNNK